MNPKVSIISVVYNSIKYIEACADSILNQTLRDIQWVVLDNGCTDGTSEILALYASRDSRVKLVKNKKNNIIYPDAEHVVSYWTGSIDYADGEYFTMLDSDDTYDLTFAERMYAFAKEYDADIVACGTTMIQETNSASRSHRIPPLFVNSNPARIGDNLSAFYGSFRPVWGKLFRTKMYLENTRFINDRPSYLLNGSDTFFCLRFMQIANRIICLNESLHTYLIRAQSAYHSNLYADRWKCYDLLYHEGRALLDKWNKLTLPNLSFLSLVHFHSVLDCIDVVKRAGGATAEERVDFIKNMLGSNVLSGYLTKLEARAINGLLVKANDTVGEIYKYDKSLLFLWYCCLYDISPAFSSVGRPIKHLFSKSVLLKSVNIKQAVFLKEAIAEVLRGDLPEAVNALFALAERFEIPDEHAESYIKFGQNVCAAAEHAEGFIFFNKIWISYLLDCSRIEEARKALNEFEQILPDDEDVINLRKRVGY